MARKRTGRRRGRPRKVHAKRRATMRQGRKTGIDPVDDGTPPLRLRKLRLTGRTDLELTPAALLFARGHLDAGQYDSLGQVTFALARLARNLGPKGLSAAGLWAAVTGGIIGTAGVTVPIAVGRGADVALARLGRMLGRLNGCRDLVISIAEERCPPLIAHVLEGRITGADERALDQLRTGLDSLAGAARRLLKPHSGGWRRVCRDGTCSWRFRFAVGTDDRPEGKGDRDTAGAGGVELWSGERPDRLSG